MSCSFFLFSIALCVVIGSERNMGRLGGKMSKRQGMQSLKPPLNRPHQRTALRFFVNVGEQYFKE